jgi:hypothetical protein
VPSSRSSAAKKQRLSWGVGRKHPEQETRHKVSSAIAPAAPRDPIVLVLVQGDGSSTSYLNGAGVDEKLEQAGSSGPLYFIQDRLGSK